MRMRAFVQIVFFALGACQASFAGRADCRRLIDALVEVGPSTAIHPSRLDRLEFQTGRGSLISYRERLTPDQIRHHNEKVLLALRDPIEITDPDRVAAITQAEANRLVKLITHHPTNGYRHEIKYDPDDCYGFCFGRAVLVHSEAIRRGVDPAAIKKVWAVGSLEKGKWHFHVATMIKASRTGSWWVVDPVYASAINIETWIGRMQNSSDDNQMMVFVTDPRRFSVYSPRHYTEIDLLGDGKTDYYRGYFSDYLNFTAEQSEPRPFKQK